MKNEKKIYNTKIVLLGEAGVGKTSLINAYFDEEFDMCEITSSTPKHSYKTLELNNYQFNICILDTMGQEKYRSLTRNFIKGSDIVILVYDITRRETFLELNFWLNLATEILGEEIIFGVAANKIDLFENSEVEKKEGKEFAQKLDGLFEETSGKANSTGFKDFIKKLLNKLISNKNIMNKIVQTIEKRDSFPLKKSSHKKRKKCCNNNKLKLFKKKK